MSATRNSNSSDSKEDLDRMGGTRKEEEAGAATQVDETTELTESELLELDRFSNDGGEKKLVLRLDIFLAPVIMLSYGLSFLDRSNIGTAGTAGLQRDLSLNGDQFNIATSIFYVTYVLVETPAAILFRKYGANNMIPLIVTAWGFITTFSGFVQSYPGLLVTRLLLGLCEGGLFPSLNLLLPSFYTRTELARRTSFIFGAAALSGMFGGLLGFGILKLDGKGGYEGWRWIYILEGAFSILFGLACFFILPDNPERAYFLNESEKRLASLRLKKASLYQGSGPFEWNQVRKALTDWKVYLSALSQFGSDVCLYGFSTFLPVILSSGLGYDKFQTQYMTVPVYCWGAGVYFTTAYMSDRFHSRAIPLITTTAVTIVGYSILIGVRSSYAVLYFACFLVATGIYVAPGLNVTWLNANHSGQWKRATAMGFQQTLANTSGILSGQIYLSRNAPFYRTGHIVSLCSITVANAGFWALWYVYRSENKIRDQIASGQRSLPKDAEKRTGDADLRFRYQT